MSKSSIDQSEKKSKTTTRSTEFKKPLFEANRPCWQLPSCAARRVRATRSRKTSDSRSPPTTPLRDPCLQMSQLVLFCHCSFIWSILFIFSILFIWSILFFFFLSIRFLSSIFFLFHQLLSLHQYASFCHSFFLSSLLPLHQKTQLACSIRRVVSADHLTPTRSSAMACGRSAVFAAKQREKSVSSAGKKKNKTTGELLESPLVSTRKASDMSCLRYLVSSCALLSITLRPSRSSAWMPVVPSYCAQKIKKKEKKKSKRKKWVEEKENTMKKNEKEEWKRRIKKEELNRIKKAITRVPMRASR